MVENTDSNVCNFHVLSNLLLIYICKLHWNRRAFEKFRHTGDIVWSVKTNVLQPNCVLLNHWSQQAILLTDYTFAGGARGVELVPSTGVQGGNVYEWPSAALDLELTQKKWQPCLVSENIISGQILSMFPKGQSILNRKIT